MIDKSNNNPSSLQLTAANGQSISSWGDRWISLKFGNRRFEWSFHLADVDQPLLGADFLKAFNLLVDVAAAQILDSSSLQVISSSVLPPANQSPFYTATPGANQLPATPETNQLHSYSRS